MRFVLVRCASLEALQVTRLSREFSGAALLRPGEVLHWATLAPHTSFVIPLLDAPHDPQRTPHSAQAPSVITSGITSVVTSVLG